MGAALGIIVALVPVVSGRIGSLDIADPLAKIERRVRGIPDPKPDLGGLDLLRLKLHPSRVTAPLNGGRIAELTLDPELQRTTSAVMRRYNIPEAGVVMMDVRTGKLLVYASHVDKGEPFDVNVRAEAPAASVFKVVTGAALVEEAGLRAKTEQCYHGGRSRITADELKEDPRRDKWCANLALAMGRSINVVFARLARKHLTPESITEVGGAFGFGSPVPFAVPNEAPQIDIPPDPLEFARASAGFWHTSLSPLAGAVLAQTVANDGVALKPRIIAAVLDDGERIWEETGEPELLRRAVKAETAHEVTRMMRETVAQGSAFKAFHDARGKPYLPGISVAGKTGTLTRHKAGRLYTWFVGFAPADAPEVAVSALVVNTPLWRIKAPELARDALRAYFAKRAVAGVSRP